ncbi:hypothetical protein AB8U03_08100 [Clostridium sp. Mt-5]|uniref:Uncharacterized protein n=1 Tax=Clostridium moutaii TaxID=3240932 RepID=A0ABV4BNR2_9CLOT
MKIKINIYGNKNAVLSGINYCGSNDNFNNCSQESRCADCSNCKNNHNASGSSDKLTFMKTKDLYDNLKNFLEISDVSENIDINFVELNKTKFLKEEESRVENIIQKGFEPPITVIDGIIRYYGGISNILVYRDIKDLLS